MDVQLSARPYRSHKFRACDFCRRRKVRCSVETAGKACHLCHINKMDCTYILDSWNSHEHNQAQISAEVHMPEMQHESPRNLRNYRNSDNKNYPVRYDSGREKQPLQSSEVPTHENPSDSTHIVGPVTTSDAQVLEEYMSPEARNESESSRRLFRNYSAKPNRPVLYTTIPRHRRGLDANPRPGKSQREIVEHIVAPYENEVVNLYFKKINPAFPMIDYDSFVSSYYDENEHLSSTLVCDILTVTLTFWEQSTELRKYPRPDELFAWNLAVKALQDDFLAPGLSTVQAALLDLVGRPVTSITGNGITNGKTVALAYSLGLNRDPREWNITLTEQNLRIRLWWGVFIHDQWASLAHGTPPHIATIHYDVEVPTLDTMQNSAAAHDQFVLENECFIALCHLTKLLSDVLPLIYSLKTAKTKETVKALRRIEVQLDEWEDDLPEQFHTAGSSEYVVSGTSSLHLGYLVLKMLICRISLHSHQTITHSGSVDDTARLYHQAQCRASADAIVDFVVSLRKCQLEEFWLPYSAYHFTSTATLLLRCALETENDSVADSCVSSVRALIHRLTQAKAEHAWDLGDICIAQCESILNRMTTNQNGQTTIASPSTSPSQVNSGLVSVLQNSDFTVEPMDEMGAYNYFQNQGDLWDMFRFEEADFGAAQPT
ncbi:C6 transcription factor [Bisporella sp. PMI_857]|nr:C6 transcription factor [Bisporella sp. PMI_857]